MEGTGSLIVYSATPMTPHDLGVIITLKEAELIRSAYRSHHEGRLDVSLPMTHAVHLSQTVDVVRSHYADLMGPRLTVAGPAYPIMVRCPDGSYVPLRTSEGQRLVKQPLRLACEQLLERLNPHYDSDWETRPYHSTPHVGDFVCLVITDKLITLED